MSGHRADPGATPSLGSLDGLDLDGDGRDRDTRPRDDLDALGRITPDDDGRGPRRPAPPPARSRGPGRWIAAIVIVVLLGAGGWALVHWRDSLGETLVPVSDLNQQVAAARQALAEGRLSATDGSGARERFQAVLARDPDHPAARAGLAQVRDAALQQARAALAAGDVATARARLELARVLAAPAADLSLIELELQQRENAESDLAGMLQRARAAQAEGRLDQVPDGALALYQDVLRLQPDNAIALDGRRDILAGLLRQAVAAADRGDAAEAEALVARVLATDPRHLDLPAAQARVGELAGQRQRARDETLATAANALRAGDIAAAADAYRALLAAEPGQVDARQGLDDAVAAMAHRATRQAADFDFDGADASLALAETWAPGSPVVDAARERIEEARTTRGQLPSADDAQVQRLLARARDAMRRGDFIDPPGDSAWDNLRTAAAAAPDHPDLPAAMNEYDRRARACFEDELASNRLSRAQACLDALSQRDRGEGLAPERRRLADRWLAFADERLGASELALARRALRSAQALDPTHPGLAAMEERLARAGG